MISRLKNYVVYTYLIIMLGYFPLFYKKQYSGMGNGKFKVFLYTSIVCLGILLLLSIIQYVKTSITDFSTVLSNRKITYSITDLMVILYYVVCVCSLLFSDFKEDAMMGATGWNMGFVAQTIFFLSYFYISRDLKFHKSILYVLFASTGLVFLLGILHRFHIDPLQIYPGLSEGQITQFLSTIGQSSWYSSFVCTVFPVGVFVFYITKDKTTRIWSGIYTALAFMTLVTQNTDSAFLAIFAVLMVLFYMCFDSKEKIQRFAQIILIMLGSFKFMGFCQWAAGSRSVVLDTLSMEMSQGMWTTIAFIIALCAYIVWYVVFEKPADNTPVKRYLFWAIFEVCVIGTIGVIIFIYLNSTGFLYEKFGYLNTNNYLLFNDVWGNNRGLSWRFTMFSFKNLDFMEQLVGVGPDCFKAYNYSIPEYKEILDAFWNNLSLTNAHNEYLTVLFNLGVSGLIAFIGMLAAAIYRPIKHRKDNPFVPAFALCVAAYMLHNIFCYQQVCCTPFLFIFMGIGENLIRQDHQ